MTQAIDRRLFLRSSAGVGAAVVLAQATPPGAPSPLSSIRPIEPPRQPVAPPRPPAPHAAWVNYEFAITWERMNLLQEIVTSLVGRGVTDITLLISSVGGDIAAAISTYNFLTSAGIKLTTYNVGNAYSAAVVLFLAGERRVADRTAQFIIHPASATTTAGSVSLEDLQIRTEALDRESRRMRDIIAARTKFAPEKIDAMLKKTTFLDGQAALDDGLLTEIGHLVRPAATLLVTEPARPAPPVAMPP